MASDPFHLLLNIGEVQYGMLGLANCVYVILNHFTCRSDFLVH